MSSSLQTIARQGVWLLLAVCLLLDGPILVDRLQPYQDAFLDFPPRGTQHLLRDWILFGGFVVLQGLLWLVGLRLRAPIQTRTLPLGGPSPVGSENPPKS